MNDIKYFTFLFDIRVHHQLLYEGEYEIYCHTCIVCAAENTFFFLGI